MPESRDTITNVYFNKKKKNCHCDKTMFSSALYMYYRCKIPECDGPDPAGQVYEPEWLRFTIPYKHDTDTPRKCQRYALLSAPMNGTKCASSEFDANTTELCDNGWVFEDRENTIGTEVRIYLIIYTRVTVTKRVQSFFFFYQNINI